MKEFIKTRIRLVVAIYGVLLIFAFYGWTRGWFNSRPIDLLDFTAEEVAVLNIGLTEVYAVGFPEVTDKVDIERFIDEINRFYYAGNIWKDESYGPGKLGGIHYSAKFVLTNGEIVSLGMHTTSTIDPRVAEETEVIYGTTPPPDDQKHLVRPIARGSLAIFYELYDKYAPSPQN